MGNEVKRVENEEVENILKSLSSVDGHAVKEYIRQLEDEIDELNRCINHNDRAQQFFTNNQVEIIQKLEKAIDKACDELEKLEGYYMDSEEYIHTESCIQWNCLEWKEWCMKDE